MPRDNERQFLIEALRGNASAVNFCETLFRATHVIDDLIDKDRSVNDGDIFRTFWDCLFELPVNPFYRQHEPYLRPILANGFQDWWDSVKLERAGDAHARTLSFVLRDSLTSVVVQCAYLVGGYDWMQQVSEAIRRHAHEDTLEQYMTDLQGGAQ
nr:hypothetical protein [uncultured Halomonas sp.]